MLANVRNPAPRCRIVDRHVSITFGQMITRARLIDVLFVIVPHSLLLDIAGPAEAFRLANQHRGRRGLPPRFRLRFAAPVATSRTRRSGCPSPAWSRCRRSSPHRRGSSWSASRREHLGDVTPAVTTTARWLNAASRRRRCATPAREHRLVTICSGTLLAARAGLLGSRRCTTHHELLDTLRALAPQAKVIDNRVFVVDGPIASSAGITAGIDVALHLIAGECGEALAASVAEDMVVYLRRSRSRSGAVAVPHASRASACRPCIACRTPSSSEPERDWTMAALAKAGHTTERHLLRLFIEHAGVSPLQYLQAIRLERARQALEHGASVTRAAEVAGFRSDLQMRRAWSRAVGRIAEGCVEGRARHGSSARSRHGQPALAAGCAER